MSMFYFLPLILLLLLFLRKKKFELFNIEIPRDTRFFTHPIQQNYPYYNPTGLFIPTDKPTDTPFPKLIDSTTYNKYHGYIPELEQGYSPTIEHPIKYLSKDVRCDPILDCPQKIKLNNGKIITIPPYRKRCVGNNVCN